jgi:glucan 1,3-beta-glucosidase
MNRDPSPPSAAAGPAASGRARRWFALPAFALATLAALLGWWWQGRPVALVDAPAATVPCVSYAPYRGAQTPFDETLVIPPGQIAEDLAALRPFSRCVRTYAIEQGLDAVPGLAQALGMTVMLGAWIGPKPLKNEAEIARAIDLANRYPGTVEAVIVGNEVLLRREQPPERLKAMIERVRAAVPVPVTYADVWEFWRRHAGLAASVDFVTIHTLPYWEDEPVGIDRAVGHAAATRQGMQALFPDKPVIIGEAGWPSAGRMREAALPSGVNQARFVRELLARAAADGFRVNLIEAFDQPWKRRSEGTVGGHWGLFGADRRPKFALQGPVSADPDWLRRFGLATMLAAAGVLGLGRRRLRSTGWLALAAAAQVTAAATVVAAGDALDASRTVLDWAVAAAQLTFAVAAPLAVGWALLAEGGAGPRPVAVEALLAAVRRLRPPPAPRPAAVLGGLRLVVAVAAAATTLTLVFDGRYRDFPVAAYGAAAGAFAVLAWTQRRVHLPGDGREERLLGALLAVGGVAVVIGEGVRNAQALAWAATALTLAGPLLLERHEDRRSAAGSG